jgi:hypothetical protein
MIDYKKYPLNWKTELRPAALERSNHCCAFCGVKNYAVGARDQHGTWHDENSIHSMNSSQGQELFGEFPRMIKIVLTVAHLNHDITDNCPENLQALCQKCHLTYDAQHHAKNAKRTRGDRRQKQIEATGQMPMFEELENQNA